MILIGIIVSYEDIKNREISNKVIILGAITGVIIGIIDKNFIKAFIGSIIMAAPIFLLAWMYTLVRDRQGIGGGDIKVALVYGMFLKSSILIFSAYFITFITAGIMLLIKKLVNIKGGKWREIPLIPFMSIGTIVVYIIQSII